MSEPEIIATFNGRREMSFVQGEDRAVAVALRDAITGNPLDLTTASVIFEFVGASGFPVRRYSAPMVLSTSTVTPPSSNLTQVSHGLVSGDPVTFTGSGLPVPLSTMTTYLVNVIDANTFSLTDTSGTPIVITAAATSPFSLALPDVSIVSPGTSGLMTLLLRDAATSAIQDGLAQTFQISVIIAGLQRIVLEQNELDVFPQVIN